MPSTHKYFGTTSQAAITSKQQFQAPPSIAYSEG